jgi:hypothetical protein
MDGLLLEERRNEQDSGGWIDCIRELRLEIAQLRGEVATLRRENLELRQQVGYWKGMHARALERIAVLEQENEHLRGENRRLQQQIFGKKSEKQTATDRSNHIDGFNDKNLSQTDSSAADGPKKKQRGPKRRDFSHLPARKTLTPSCPRTSARVPPATSRSPT